jgi:putative SOS response-associated peptidase YedK
MCGRYASSRKPEDLVEEFEITAPDANKVREALDPDYNVAPTKPVYAVLERSPSAREDPDPEPPQRQLRVLSWGLIPSWAKDPAIGNRMINARMETVAEKPAYKRAFATRRCLLPADGYFEWYPTQVKGKAGRPLKQPFYIHPKDGGLLAMAGLYEIWRDPDRPDDDLGRIHDRMPLMVESERWSAWLDPAVSGRDELLSLLVPAAPGRLEAFPVSTDVNNVRNNGPELVAPIPAEEALT